MQSTTGTTAVRKDRTEAVRRLLASEDAYASTLLVLAVDQFGFDEETGQPRVFEWHPATVKAALEERFDVALPKLAFDRLMAAVTVVTTDLFFKDVTCFIPLANALAGDDFEPGEFEPADSVECAWAVTEALLLSPPDEQDPEPFSDEIRYYIGHVLREEGYVTPPDVLRIALDADFSDRVAYDFADDPELFGAIYENQAAKAKDVETVIRESLLELVGQLQGLPLQHGDTAELVGRLSQAIRTKETA